MFKKKYILILFLFISFFVSCKSNDEITYKTETQIAMGTVCSIKVEENVDDEIISNCFDIIMNVESDISRTKESSLISILNREKSVVVTQEIYDLFEYSIELAKMSEGNFNIAMGGIVSLWDIGGDNPRIPETSELESININYDEIKLDEDSLTIEIPENMEVDLGGLGKGYVADKIVAYLKSQNVNRAIINLGGNIVVIGEKEDGIPWIIGLQDPYDESVLFTTLKVKDLSIVTSGTYERYFYQEGIKYHHILDPETLYPSISDIVSSTIIGPNSLICDSLSTTCFILGSEKALALIDQMDGYSAFFMLEDDTIIHSDSFDIEYNLVD
ncbi:MAG: FAD:protein FMN transferase [Pleomorphochaeta sp.]